MNTMTGWINVWIPAVDPITGRLVMPPQPRLNPVMMPKPCLMDMFLSPPFRWTLPPIGFYPS